MGFTHYFKRPAILPEKTWKKFITEIEMLKDNLPERGITSGCNYTSPIVIAGWDGKSYEDPEAPIYNKEEEAIYFNGAGDLGHESLVIERVSQKERIAQGRVKKGELVFSFCKTARKPYDTFVCLVLISFKRWFMSKVEISSDGNQDDWQPAIDLYQELTKAPGSFTYEYLMREKRGKKETE